MKKHFFILIFVLVLLSSFTSAVPPITQLASGDKSLDLRVPQTNILQKDFVGIFHLHVFNSTNDVPLDNNSVSCYVHFYNSTGNHIIRKQLEYEKDYDWECEINTTITGKNQIIPYLFWCNSTDNIGGFISSRVEINDWGIEDSSNTFPFIFVFLGAAIILLWFAFSLGEEMFWVKFLLSVVGIGFVWVAVNLAHLFSIENGAASNIVSLLDKMNIAFASVTIALIGLLMIYGAIFAQEEYKKRMQIKEDSI